MTDHQGACVLVADDDAKLRDLICDMLGLAGFRTVLASDGAEVLDLAVRERPALPGSAESRRPSGVRLSEGGLLGEVTNSPPAPPATASSAADPHQLD